MADKNELTIYTPGEIQQTLTKAGQILKYLGNGLDRINYFVDTVQDVVNAGYGALCRVYNPNLSPGKITFIEQEKSEIENLTGLLLKAGITKAEIIPCTEHGVTRDTYIYSIYDRVLDKSIEFAVVADEDGKII